MRCNTLIILVRLIKCISIMGEEVQILGGGGGWICSILFFLVSLKKILLRIAIQLSTC